MPNSSKSRNATEEAATDQHKVIGVVTDEASAKTPPHTTHPDAQWFGNAGLGLFIHWGISSVYGSIDISWGMMADTPWDSGLANRNKVTPEEYFDLAERFNPDGGPWPRQSNVPVTVRTNTWYLHFTTAEVQDACVADVVEPAEVKLLRTGEAVPFSYKDRKLTVSLPQSMCTSLDDVVALTWR